MAQVGAEDYVIDLGSGDGRIVIAAVKTHGARGFGVDIDGGLVNAARREAERQGVAARAEFHERNLFVTDIGDATVVTMYLLPSVNLQLRPRLFERAEAGNARRLARLRHGRLAAGRARDGAGSRQALRPAAERGLPVDRAGQRRRHAGAGSSTSAERPSPTRSRSSRSSRCSRANPWWAARRRVMEGGRMRGDEIRLRLTAAIGGREVRHEFTGRAAGDTITGTARLDGGSELVWNAARVKRAKHGHSVDSDGILKREVYMNVKTLVEPRCRWP